MCMQDYVLGKNKSTSERTVATNAATKVQLVPQNKSRTAIVISPPTAQTMFISNNAGTAIARGMRIEAGALPFKITIEEHGDIVCQEWFADTEAGNDTITVWETMLNIPHDLVHSIWRALHGGSFNA